MYERCWTSHWVRRYTSFVGPNQVLAQGGSEANQSFLMGKHLFLGTPHWGFNLDPDPYTGSEMEPVLFQMEIRLQIAAF